MELTLRLPEDTDRLGVAGPSECNFKILREVLGVHIAAREYDLRITGRSRAVGQAAEVIDRLSQAAKRDRPLSREQLLDAILSTERQRSGAVAISDLSARPDLLDRSGRSGRSDRSGHAAPSQASVSAIKPANGQRATERTASQHRSRGGTSTTGRESDGASRGRGGVPGRRRHLEGIPRPVNRPGEHGVEQAGLAGAPIDVYLNRREIEPATPGQARYLDAMRSHDLTFCCGPAGTGKTYLAVAAAVTMLKRGEVRKLVLVRPAVEAGEKLGFLPGDLLEKVNPYLRPLLDALHDMMDFEQIQKFMACDLIEIIPLAFMRGRTLNEALIILDEAQNTTKSQMMMFLTRLGQGSKMIVTGDTTQIDLEKPTESGLLDAIRRLRRVPGVAMVTLDRQDIVRHSLVQRIVEAYGGDRTTGQDE